MKNNLDNLTGRVCRSDQPACGVVMIAVVSGVPFSEAFEATRRVCRKRKGWEGMTYQSDRLRMLRHFGVHWRLEWTWRFKGEHRETLSRWLLRLPCKPGKVFAMAVTGHSFTLRGTASGWQMVDQTTQKWAPIRPQLLRKRVAEVIEITGVA